MSRGRRRAAAIALVLLLGSTAGLYWLREPILRHIGGQLVHGDAPLASDAILVLSGGQFDRDLEAADLFRQGLAPLVLMTRMDESRIVGVLRARGVTVDPALDVHRRVLEELGVPDDRILVLEPIVSSTKDEAEALLAWYERHRPRRVLVVTSSFHTARSRYIFQSVFEGVPLELRFVPARESDFQPDTWWRHRVTLREGLFEWQKTLFYRVWY